MGRNFNLCTRQTLSMDCPRCGGRLDRYELADRVEAVCTDCGYVGVPVDHESECPADESWTDAVDRYEQAFEAGDVDTGPAPPSVPADEGDPEPTTVRTTTATGPLAGDGNEAAPTDGTSTEELANETPTEDDPTEGTSTEDTIDETTPDEEPGTTPAGATDPTPAVEGEDVPGAGRELDTDGGATADTPEPPAATDAGTSDGAGDTTSDDTTPDGTEATTADTETDAENKGDEQRAIDEYGENGRAVASPDGTGEDDSE
jgi:hypothetical protein